MAFRARPTADIRIIASSSALLVVRTAVEHEWLAADLVNLSLGNRHRAIRTASYGRPLSAQPNPEAVAGLGAVPKPKIVVRDLLHADAIL